MIATWISQRREVKDLFFIVPNFDPGKDAARFKTILDTPVASQALDAEGNLYDMLPAIADRCLKPCTCPFFTPNDDFTEWTMTLRPGVTFHDGEPLDAEAKMAFRALSLVAQGVDLLDAGELPSGVGYNELFVAVRAAVDGSHRDGVLKADVLADPDRAADDVDLGERVLHVVEIQHHAQTAGADPHSTTLTHIMRLWSRISSLPSDSAIGAQF